MKKFLALILCVLMICSMGVTAFAADGETGSKTGEVIVKITDEAGNPVTSTETYAVTIEWTGLEFQLQVNDPDADLEWDTTNSVYKITTANAKWSHNAATVTVTNSSDMAITVAAAWQNPSTTGSLTSQTTNNVSATLDKASDSLESAVSGTKLSTTFNAAISAVPSQVDSLNFTVDTIELTIAPVK